MASAIGEAGSTKGAGDELQRAAHTLQGLAATLGAPGLQARAAALAQAAKRQDAASAVLLADVEVTLDALLEQLAQVTAPAAPVAPPTQAGELTMTSEEALDGLRELLEQSDAHATEWWQTHRRALRQGLPPAAMRAVGAAINGFDFDAALKALDIGRTGKAETLAEGPP